MVENFPSDFGSNFGSIWLVFSSVVPLLFLSSNCLATDCRVGHSPRAHRPSRAALVLVIKWPVKPPPPQPPPPPRDKHSSFILTIPAAGCSAPLPVPAPRHKTSARLSERDAYRPPSICQWIILSCHVNDSLLFHPKHSGGGGVWMLMFWQIYPQFHVTHFKEVCAALFMQKWLSHYLITCASNKSPVSQWKAQ